MRKKVTATTPTSYQSWLSKANKGDSCVYYKGFLYIDRCWAAFSSKSEAAMEARVRIAAANIAWRDAEEGYIALTQRKLGDMEYEYIATRLS